MVTSEVYGFFMGADLRFSMLEHRIGSRPFRLGSELDRQLDGTGRVVDIRQVVVRFLLSFVFRFFPMVQARFVFEGVFRRDEGLLADIQVVSGVDLFVLNGLGLLGRIS